MSLFVSILLGVNKYQPQVLLKLFVECFIIKLSPSFPVAHFVRRLLTLTCTHTHTHTHAHTQSVCLNQQPAVSSELRAHGPIKLSLFFSKMCVFWEDISVILSAYRVTEGLWWHRSSSTTRKRESLHHLFQQSFCLHLQISQKAFTKADQANQSLQPCCPASVAAILQWHGAP